jgi:hypothetical protein
MCTLQIIDSSYDEGHSLAWPYKIQKKKLVIPVEIPHFVRNDR